MRNNNRTFSTEKSKAKQQRLALVAGLLVIFGIILLVVLMLMQKNKIEENNVVTTMSIDELHDNVDTLEESTAELKSQLESMLAQLESMDGVIQTNKETVESINTTATGSGENIARAEKDILSLQKTLSEYIKQFETETNNTNSEIKEQFNAVNNDVEKLLQEINNNNDNQTTNYKELSNQMDKTLKDMNSFIEKLSKENDAQYKELTKQTEEFQTKLNEYLENFNSELNATIKEDIDGVNTHLNTVQNDIATTKSEITNLLDEINEGQTKDIQTKFNAIQKHLDDITTHFDKTLEDITDLINNLSAQNKKEYEDTIETLSNVKNELSNANTNTANELKKQLGDMSTEYLKQFESLQTNVDLSFTNINTKIDNNKNDLNTKLDNLETTINENSNMSNLSNEELKALMNDLKNDVSGYSQKVDQSFTSVSNGKEALYQALLTKYEQFGIGTPKGAGGELQKDSTFNDFATAINGISQMPQVAGSIVLPENANLEYVYHHHTLGTIGDKNDKTINNTYYQNDYQSENQQGCFTVPNYVRHIHSTSATTFTQTTKSMDEAINTLANDYQSNASSGCYTAQQVVYHRHTGSVSRTPNGCCIEPRTLTDYNNIVGYTEKIKCGHWDCTSRSGGRSYFKCSGCGARADHYDGGASSGWGMGSHYIGGDPIYGTYTEYYCPKSESTIDRIYYTCSCGRTAGQLERTYYTAGCNFLEGQIVEAHIYYSWECPNCHTENDKDLGTCKNCGTAKP